MKKLIKSADTMRKNAYDGSMDSEQILDEAEKEIFSIATGLRARTILLFRSAKQTTSSR